MRFVAPYLKPDIRTTFFQWERTHGVIVETPDGQFLSSTERSCLEYGAVSLRRMLKFTQHLDVTPQLEWSTVDAATSDPPTNMGEYIASWLRDGFELVVRGQYALVREGLKTSSPVPYYRVWDIGSRQHAGFEYPSWIMRESRCLQDVFNLPGNRDPAILEAHRHIQSIDTCLIHRLVAVQCSDELFQAVCTHPIGNPECRCAYAAVLRLIDTLMTESDTLGLELSNWLCVTPIANIVPDN